MSYCVGRSWKEEEKRLLEKAEKELFIFPLHNSQRGGGRKGGGGSVKNKGEVDVSK